MLKQIIPHKVNKVIKSNQKAITFSIKFLLAGGLLYFLLVKLNYKEIYELFLNVDAFYLSLASILIIANLGFRFAKWHLVASNFFPEIKLNDTLISFFYGIVGYLSIPLSVGEFVGRTTVLKKFGTIKVILATAIDRYSSLLLLAFSGLLASAYYLYDIVDVSFSIYIILLSIILILALLVAWVWVKRRIVLKVIKQRFGEKKFLVNLKKYFGMLYELDNKLLVKVFLLSALSILTYLTQFTLLMLAFGADLSIMNLYWISLLVMFCKSVIPPITFGELGIREGVTVYFAKSFALPITIGFNAAFSLFVINIIIPALIGLLFFFRKSK